MTEATTKAIEFLELNGYESYSNSLSQAVWTGSKRLPSDEITSMMHCETNDHKIGYHVEIHEMHLPNQVSPYRSVKLEIVGEKYSLWFNLNTYSLDLDELQYRLLEVEHYLLKAWIAICVE